MKIKVNDKVQVMSGKDKGKTGKVLQVLPDMKKVVVEGIQRIRSGMNVNASVVNFESQSDNPF